MFNFETSSHAQPVRMAPPDPLAPSLRPGLLLGALRRRLGLVLLAGSLAMAAGFGILRLLQPVYTAAIEILIDPIDLRTLDGEVTMRTPQADAGITVAESQARVVQSNAVLRRVVERLHLDADPYFVRPDSANPTVLAVKRFLGMDVPAQAPDPVTAATDTLRQTLQVRRPERTFVIEVSAKADAPQKAADIANAIGAAYFAEESESRKLAAKRISDALAGRLEVLRQGVEEADRRIVAYRRDNRLTASGGRLLTDQQLADLNQQLVTASIRAAEAHARLSQAERMKVQDAAGTALPEMLQSAEMQGLRQQAAALARSIAETGTRLGQRHPAMADLYAQQRAVAERIQIEKARIVDGTRKEAERASASEAAIRRQLNEARAQMISNDSAGVGLQELERERDARRSVYESVLKRARETGEQERVSSVNLRVLSDAVAPKQRSFPPSPKVVLPAAFLVGLGLAAALVMGLAVLAAGRSRPAPVPLPVERRDRFGTATVGQSG